MHPETLFIGSSQIARWPLPKTAVLKHAKFPRELFALRLPKHASRIVVYCGSNDILHGLDPVENILPFVEVLCQRYPDAEITLLAILLSPRATKFAAEIRRANDRIRRGLPSDVNYVNMNRTLVHPKYYCEDGLHLNATGYEVWERAI